MKSLNKIAILENFLQMKELPIIEGKDSKRDVSVDWINECSDLKDLEKGIPLHLFIQKSKLRNIEMEFRIIRRITETVSHSEDLYGYDPNIIKLIRYNNIVPYIHSIVKIPYTEENNSLYESFINANYIKTPMEDSEYFIATQGPLKSSISHFWKMVWNENSDFIIMLCRLQESGKIQCDQYWPNSNSPIEIFNNEEKIIFKISLEKFSNESEYVQERIFKIQKFHDEECTTRFIKHILWLGWPDHGVPTMESDYLTTLLEQMYDHYIPKSSTNKIIVHCSAGIGRTGTIIAIFNLILVIRKFLPKIKELIHSDSIELNNYKISIFGAVRRLREQRWGMVHTSEQYKYIYEFIQKFLENEFENL